MTDADIATLRQRITAAERARARAEAQHEAAAQLADRARRRLADEFGVADIDAARTLLVDLDTTLERELHSLREQLDSLGM